MENVAVGSGVQVERVEAGELDVAYVTAGPPDGPLALCLHGFPDSARTWDGLLLRLAAAGFRAVAPWLRGYAPTSVPPSGDYSVGALAADAVAVHAALAGDERAVIIGHDWGALAAYGAASVAPARFRRVVAMAVPPPAILLPHLLRYSQLRRSWYWFFFQQPTAEAAVAADGFDFIDRLWADWSPGLTGAAAAAAVADAKAALRAPANLSAALGYYRALVEQGAPRPEVAEAQAASYLLPAQPTLYMHGTSDGCVGVETVDGLAELLPAGSAVRVLSGAGHFLHLEQPEAVARAVVDFVSA